jgi:ribose transport system substrate-binding protein
MRAWLNSAWTSWLALSLSLVVSACNTITSTNPPVDNRPIILLVLKDYNNEFFRKIEEGFRQGMSPELNKNYHLDVRYGTTQADITYERRLLDQCLANYVVGQRTPKLKAVVMAPGSSNNELTSQIKQLKDSHIIVVIADQRINEDALKRAKTDYDAFIGSRNLDGGALAADELAKDLPGGGTVLILNGIPDVRSSIDRRAGFLDRLTQIYKQKGLHYKIVERRGNFMRSDAQRTLNEMLSKGQQPDGIFAVNDEMALGALEALRQERSHKKTVIVGFDAIQEAVTAVKDGRLAATIAQDPVAIGKKSAAAVEKLLKQEPVVKDEFLTPNLIRHE